MINLTEQSHVLMCYSIALKALEHCFGDKFEIFPLIENNKLFKSHVDLKYIFSKI